ncbi:MAG: efflux RND transporter permease subunit [Holosporaceae bacterium]|nr:MAG: efflux RND transporter permease subunit [Holosporaceae bacterium]
MEGLISLCLRFRRSVLLLFSFLLIAGGITYFSIPRESDPDVQIPLVVVRIDYDGASPEDCERLILRPAEQHLQSIEGVKEIRSTAYQASVTLLVEFFADMDIDRALTLIRNKINLIKSEIPKNAKEPVVEEINVSLFPVLTVELFGHAQERYLFKVAEGLQEQIERIDKVLEAKIIGSRDEVVEIQVDPLMLEKYSLIFADIKNLFTMNNAMARSGKLRAGDAWFYLKTPSLVQEYQEFLDFPIKTTRSSVVRLKDIASVRKTFKWPHTYANSDGIPSVTLEVKKRIGQNIIQTIGATKSAVKQFMSGVQDTVQVRFSEDKSTQIRDMLSELQNNIIFSILLVMLVMIWALGWRSAILVGVAIPASFLSGIFFLGLMKVTLNVVVLFSLILSVGMLVDGAIIVVEYADRKMAEGPRSYGRIL